MTYKYNPAGNDKQCQMIALICDNQQIADTTPTWTSVFESVHPNTHLNNTTVGRFTIFKRVQFFLDAEHQVRQIDWNVPMRHHVRYNGTAAADIQKGGLYLAEITDQDTENFPVCSIHSCVMFHDN